MRKFIKSAAIIAIISILISIPFFAKAAGTVSYSISSSSASVYPGSTFTVSVYISGANARLASNTITINYDTSKFQYVSYSVPAPATSADVMVNTMSGSVIYLYTDSKGGMNPLNNGVVATFTFKALSSYGAGNISFVAEGAADQNASSYNISKATGSTSVNIVSPPVISSNNYLSSITVAGGSLSPAFNRNTTSYSIVVDAADTTINATAEDGTATIQGTGYTALNFGLNTFYVTCTAANGTSRTYILNITRPVKGSTNTSLYSLSVSNTSISYNGGYTYSATVDNSVKKVKIDARAVDSKTSLKGTGIQYLSVGENNFVVTAISESGITASYNIVITRKSKGFGGNKDPEPEKDPEKEENKSDSNLLKSLEVTGATFKFNKDRFDYYLTVPYTQETLEINYEAESESAIVRVNAESTLKVGSNVAIIEVEAENGDVKTYQIVITRNDEVAITEYTPEAIIAALDNQLEVVVAVDANSDSMLLDESILTKLKETKKLLTIKILDEFGNIQEVIIINGADITDTSTLSLDLIRNITDKKLLQSLDSSYISVNTKGSNIPDNTIFRHYIDSIKDKFILYYIEKGDVATQKLEIKNGYVEFTLNNNANYAIVKMPAEAKDPVVEKPEEKPVKIEDDGIGFGKWIIFGSGTIALAGSAAGVAYIIRKKKSIIDGAEVEYLDLEPENNAVAAPAVDNSAVDTIPAMDTLDIDVETLSSEPAVEMLAIPDPSITPKDETTGAKENYHYEWQKEYFTKKEKEDKIKADLNELLDPKYEIKPILSAEAIADTFVDVKIDFDFEPIDNSVSVTAEESVESLENSTIEVNQN